MVNLADSYKAKWLDGSGQHTKQLQIYISGADLSLRNDSILAESMVLKEGIFDGNGALSFAGCIASMFSIDFRIPQLTPDNLLYPSDNLYPGKIETALKGQAIEVKMRVDDDGYLVPIFKGYIDSVQTSKEDGYQHIECYDKLSYIGQQNVYDTYAALNDTFTLKHLRQSIAYALGITEKTQDLPCDQVVIHKNITSDNMPAIDIIKQICQLNGVFGIINRFGELEYRSLTYWSDTLPYPSDQLFPSVDFYPGTIETDNHEYIDAYKSIVYEDYAVELIDNVVVRDSGSDENIGYSGVTGNILYVEGNALIEGEDSATKTAIALDMLANIDDVEYMPYTAVVQGRPWIECGDNISLYVYEYTSLGDYAQTVMSFPVLTRTLKGIQWLEDEYGARGEQYQPETTPSGGVASVQSEVNNVKTDVREVQEELKNKQNYIDMDLLDPVGSSGEEGDLIFWGSQGDSFKRLYRYEDDDWVRLTFEQSDTQEPDNNDGVEGDVLFQNDGANIINIWQKTDDVWMDLLVAGRHIYATAEHKVGEWINENDVYEKTYKLENLPSNGSLTYPHGIGGFGLILYARGMRNTNKVFTDLLCDNKISVDGTNITLTSAVAQSGNAYLTIGYTKPYGGYYTTNQYYKYNTGEVCTGWYASSSKTAEGDCYCGMIVALTPDNRLHWVPFCLSKLEATANAMQYRYGVATYTGNITFEEDTWYYSHDMPQASMATSLNIDNTQPESRRYYYGPINTWDEETILLALLNDIYN